MPGKDLFEYAVIRVVPKVEREEFMNVGIVLYCAKQKKKKGYMITIHPYSVLRYVLFICHRYGYINSSM